MAVAVFDGQRIVFRSRIRRHARQNKCKALGHMEDEQNVVMQYNKKAGRLYQVCLICKRESNREYMRRVREENRAA